MKYVKYFESFEIIQKGVLLHLRNFEPEENLPRLINHTKGKITLNSSKNWIDCFKLEDEWFCVSIIDMINNPPSKFYCIDSFQSLKNFIKSEVI